MALRTEILRTTLKERISRLGNKARELGLVDKFQSIQTELLWIKELEDQITDQGVMVSWFEVNKFLTQVEMHILVKEALSEAAKTNGHHPVT